jgi:hypothetical protein
MKVVLKNTQRVLLASVILLGATLACNFDQRENAISKLDKEYLIDSSTILESLAQGKKDIFYEWKDASEEGLISSNQIVSWSQADYFRIADALHHVVWNEPLSNMNLFLMHYSLDCSETENGFQYAQFMVSKIIKTDRGETRIRHGIEIDPRNNYVAAWETEYYPVLANWKSIDLSKVKISEERALQIAEKNGGQKKRIEVNNECHISVGISRDTIIYDGWMVNYSPSIFFDKIDPVTGK